MPNPDRHAVMERICEYCGEPFMARIERVNAGQGRFCSLSHANLYAQENPKWKPGIEHGKPYWSGGKWIVRWYDDDGNPKTTSYANWWWRLNVGEIPEGHVIKLKDKNPENIDPSNFECVLRGVINKNNAQFSVYTPRDITSEERAASSNRTKKNWLNGVYDSYKGDGHPNWRGGKSKEEYPREFYNIRQSVLERDNYRCQVCGKDISNERFQQVHHRNANKQDNDPENLLSLCIHCHGQVHSKKPTSEVIMALRSELYQ